MHFTSRELYTQYCPSPNSKLGNKEQRIRDYPYDWERGDISIHLETSVALRTQIQLPQSIFISLRFFIFVGICTRQFMHDEILPAPKSNISATSIWFLLFFLFMKYFEPGYSFCACVYVCVCTRARACDLHCVCKLTQASKLDCENYCTKSEKF